LPETILNQWRKFGALAESANDEIVPVRAIKAEHIHDGFAFGGIDQLANAQQGFAAGNRENIRDARVGGSRINLFVGNPSCNFFRGCRSGFPSDGSGPKPRNPWHRGSKSQSEGLRHGKRSSLMAANTRWGKGKASRSFVFVFAKSTLRQQEAAADICSCSSLNIEVNLSGDKSTDAAASRSMLFEKPGHMVIKLT
jgi:hypothetical protein